MAKKNPSLKLPKHCTVDMSAQYTYKFKPTMQKIGEEIVETIKRQDGQTMKYVTPEQ